MLGGGMRRRKNRESENAAGAFLLELAREREAQSQQINRGGRKKVRTVSRIFISFSKKKAIVPQPADVARRESS